MRLFISYSRDDKHFVHELAKQLKNEAEHDVWLDKELSGGEIWWNAILDNIETCECFIIVLTPLSVSSEYCHAELNHAFALHKPILPLLLKDCPALPPSLEQIHHIDLRPLTLEQILIRCIRALAHIEAGRQSRGYQAQIRPARPTMPMPKPITGERKDAISLGPIRNDSSSWPMSEETQREKHQQGTQILAEPPVLLPKAPSKTGIDVKISPIDEKSMQLIPASPFIFGNGEARELAAFYIDTWPVTNAEYWRFMKENNIAAPATWRGGNFPQEKADHPVTGISWYEAMAYAQWAKKRLPSAAEWEKAARGTDGRQYPWGNGFDAQRCNTNENRRGTTTPVRQYEQGISFYGVIDMAGNVWEWTSDEMRPRGIGRKGQETKRILKGGSWKMPKGSAECAAQTSAWPRERLDDTGFRCVQSVEPQLQ